MEELMQYVWRFRLWPPSAMVTVGGERIDVIDPGELNRASGPDFFNAKISIGGQIWIGNVEIHRRASDWMRHGHQRDRAYDNVVLHVVEVDDCPVYRTDGQLIPQMVMRCAADFSQQYARMAQNPALELPCAPELPQVPQINISDWICALAYERLQAKADRAADHAKSVGGNWMETIYVTLARALGFGSNSDQFELLARTTPLKALLRHSDEVSAVEAMLFGQAGMLAGLESSSDGYVQRLASDYAFYSAKYGLQRSPSIFWKMGTRPQNFPHRRIAALARFVAGGFRFGSSLFAVKDESDARALFDIKLDGFWARHYTLADNGAGTSPRAFSQASISVLIINVVTPLLYAMGQETGDADRQQAAAELLQQLKPESNSIIQIFERAGMRPGSAFDSQALIQLRREYCVPRKCLFCRIGHRLLSSKVVRS